MTKLALLLLSMLFTAELVYCLGFMALLLCPLLALVTLVFSSRAADPQEQDTVYDFPDTVVGDFAPA